MRFIAGLVSAASPAPKLRGRLKFSPRARRPWLVDEGAALERLAILGPRVCHAIGVILDGAANAKGTPSRGARFNSALRYVHGYPGRLAVVVSEDGHVDLFPRLRPQIEKAELDSLLSQLSDLQPSAKLSSETQGVCRRLAQYYRDYVPPEILDTVLMGSMRPFLDDEGQDLYAETYDVHDSDRT